VGGRYDARSIKSKTKGKQPTFRRGRVIGTGLIFGKEETEVKIDCWKKEQIGMERKFR